jgi:hypothetical protein
MTAPTIPGVVARWATRTRPAAGATCDECAELLDGARCPGCGQLAGTQVGMLATLIDTPAGPQLVIAQRTAGGWAPIRTAAATPDNVRAMARPHVTGPVTAAVGGLW